MKEFTLSEKKLFFGTIGSLYEAGYSYTDIFKTIETSTTNKKIIQLAYIIRTGLDAGTPVTALVKRYKDIIGPQYTMLFCAGDTAGKLEETTETILKDIRRTENLRNSIISSLTYPVLLLLGAIGVLMFCHFFFFKIFENMTASINLSALFFSAIFKICIVYAAIFGFVFYLFLDKKLSAKILDFIKEHTFLAPLIKNIYYTNFFSVLAAFYDAGIPIRESVETASDLFKTKREILGLVRTNSMLENNADVTSAFMASLLFDNNTMSHISVGEKTGKLGQEFKTIAKIYEKNIKTTLDVIISILQPAAIVLVGILVGYIAVNFYGRLYGGIFNSL